MAGKIKKLMPRVVFTRLEHLYQRMEDSYNQVAGEIGFTCQGCWDNCCNSFFKHHTRVEWAYFWRGLGQCTQELRQEIVSRAQDYVRQMHHEQSQGRTPLIMCPVNRDGWCMLYEHRLMICRLHGVPSTHTTPRGQVVEFPGCFRCQEQTQYLNQVPKLDRTLFYREMAELEQGFVGPKITGMERVNLTLAEMILKGPP